jgi:G3E family GTPase
VAAVNIDAKLLLVNTNTTNSDSQKVVPDSSTVVQLQNGCACCSLADELLGSLERLLQLQSSPLSAITTTTSTTTPRRQLFDAVIVELSGVADPVAVQNNWNDAVAQKLHTAVTDTAYIANVITVVDACTFGSDYMTWDVAGDRPPWFTETTADDGDTTTRIVFDSCTVNRKVVELLAEQVEAANVIVINKQDMEGAEQVAVARSMATSLNDKAVVLTTSWGKVSVQQLLQDYHHTTTTTTTASTTTTPSAVVPDDDCSNPDCTDSTHAHSHAHDDHANCAEPDCTDASHSHSHAHDDRANCDEADCTDASHSHSHEQHQHSSSPQKIQQKSTSTDNLGIGNFVYKAARPFDADRLMQLLYKWPVPVKDELDLSLLKDAAKNGYSVHGGETARPSPFTRVLRSKGFCWFAPVHWDSAVDLEDDDAWRHNTAMYWSHAGKHLGIQDAGRWWHSMPDTAMREFFATNAAEYERILREDFVTAEFGDRRQELVFIGVDLQEPAIRDALDACLLTDAEMEAYREQANKVVEVPMETIQ